MTACAGSGVAIAVAGMKDCRRALSSSRGLYSKDSMHSTPSTPSNVRLPPVSRRPSSLLPAGQAVSCEPSRPLLSLLARLGGVLAVLGAVLLYRTPLLLSIRTPVMTFVTLGIVLGLSLELRALGRDSMRRWPTRFMVALWVLCLALVLAIEGRFRLAKGRVLAASPAELQAVGAHLVVGFRSLDELYRLSDQETVAGVYISRRNLQRIDPVELHRALARIQGERRARHQPPLLVTADQEGGVVSHLSPTLTRLPGLGTLIDRGVATPVKILDYAHVHGRELASLGVNINFAPVVDLRLHVERALDRYTNIEARSISGDPALVAAVAGPYCEGLASEGIACTLKHFPGIGRVREDTHYFAGHLQLDRRMLEQQDFWPFRQLVRSAPPSTLMMLSHTIVDAVDERLPASMSASVVDGLLRQEWGFDGVLITDDLSMFPISLGPGVGEASVRALASGVDLLLLSYDPDLYYVAVDELLSRSQEIPAERLANSERRVRALQRWLTNEGS